MLIRCICVKECISKMKKTFNFFCLAACFKMFSGIQFERFGLPVSFRYSLIEHYNKKYAANITIPNLGFNNNNLTAFLASQDFWYLFKASDSYKKNNDVRLMWFIEIEGGHSTPIFYIQENGKRAILIADSLGTRVDSLPSIPDSVMCRELDIPIFIIQDRRQNDSYSCYLDALVWGKLVTGKFANGMYRIPQLLECLFQHSERIQLDNSNFQLLYVKKLPTTLLATAQSVDFMIKYRVEGDDTYVTSKGSVRSFDQFLNENKQAFFPFDYLRSKGVLISYRFYKYLSCKETFKYGWSIFCSKANIRVSLTYSDVGLIGALSFLGGYAVRALPSDEVIIDYLRSRIAKVFGY